MKGNMVLNMVSSTLILGVVMQVSQFGQVASVDRIGDDNKGRDWFLCPFDGDACFDYDDCDVSQAHIRAGFTCDAFPYYSGGIWEEEWRRELKVRNCTIDSSDTYCDVWYAVDYKVDSTEAGYCQCEKSNNANKYCEIWVCYQEGYDPTLNTLPVYNPISLEPCEGDNKNDQNFTLYCPTSSLSSTLEIIQCWCYVSGGNSEYCLQFYCEERDYFTDGSYSDAIKFSYHLCESYFPLEGTEYDGNFDYFNKFCWKWRGDKESEERFEISECVCTTPHSSANYCTDWYCNEKEMPYYVDRELFLFGIWFFNIFVFVFNMIPLVVNKKFNECINLKSRAIVMIWFITGLFVINIGTILCSGIIAEIFYLVIWYFSWHFVFIYYPYKTCNSYRIVCFRISICDNLCCLWDKIDNIIHVNMIDGIGQNYNHNNNNNNGGAGAGGGGARVPRDSGASKSIQSAFLSSRKEFKLIDLYNRGVIDKDSVNKQMFIRVMNTNSNVSDKEKKLVSQSNITIFNDLYFTVQQRTKEDFMIDIKFKIKDYGSVFPFEGIGNTEFNLATLSLLLNEESQTKYNSNEINWNIQSIVNFFNTEFDTGFTNGDGDNDTGATGAPNGNGGAGQGAGYDAGYDAGAGNEGGNKNVELQLYQE